MLSHFWLSSPIKAKIQRTDFTFVKIGNMNLKLETEIFTSVKN